MALTVRKKLVFGFISILGLVLLLQLVRLSLYKNFSIDEFTYAHAGWLIAKGELPYRDFFSHHLPLSYFIFSIPFLLFGDNPSNILYLRFMTWPFLLISFWAVFIINRNHMPKASWITVFFLLSIPTYVIFATESRPDLMALSTFFLSICLCFVKKNNSFLRDYFIGFLLGVSICFSEKVLCYGSIFGAGFLIDLLYNSRRQTGFMIGNPKAVVFGILTVAGGCLFFLTKTGSYQSWLIHSVQFTLDYQSMYDGFSWRNYLKLPLIETFWLIPFAFMGAWQSFLTWAHAGEKRWSNPEVLIIGGLFTSFLSYSIQKQPFPYSLIPFFFFIAIYAGRGVVIVFNDIQKMKVTIRNTLILFIGLTGFIYFGYSNFKLNDRLERDNSYQLEILEWIGRNTDATDVIYDNSGSYVSRPHASFYYFTNAFMRQKWDTFLNENIPTSIEESGATVFIRDSRYDSLPEDLKNYIGNNYFPFDNNIWVWGKKFLRKDFIDGEDQFHSIRTGEYFVWPREVMEHEDFHVDGKKFKEQTFHLDEGIHSVSYSGGLDGFYLLWLPRKERPFPPTNSTESTFVPIF